jgi:hypothetical protein
VVGHELKQHAERYRKRAGELRVIAETMSDPKSKQMMLEAAGRFEQIADSAKHLGPRSPLFRDL